MTRSALLCLALAMCGAPAAAAPNGVGIPGEGTPRPAARPAPLLAVWARGEQVWSGGQDGALRRWTLDPKPTSEVVGRLPGAVVALAGDGEVPFALADSGHVAAVTTTAVVVAHHSAGGLDLAVGPGGLLAVAGADGAVRLWGRAGEERGAFEAHTGPVAAVAFDPAKPERLWTAGWDGRLRCWSVRARRGAARARRVADHEVGPREACALAVGADGGRLLTGGFDGALRLWSVPRRPGAASARSVGERPHAEWLRQVRLDAAGRWAVGVAAAESALVVVPLSPSLGAPRVLTRAQVPAAAAFLDADRLAVGHFDGTLAVVDLREGAQ